MTEAISRRRFTAEEVTRMVEAGILAEDEPIELIDGELIVVTPQGPEHVVMVDRIAKRLELSYGPGFHVRRQAPIEAGAQSLPEPDVAVVSGSSTDFFQRHPRGSEVVLAIEVARTTQAVDRAKAPIYARAGVPVYWIVDLEARCLEVFTHPASGRYGVRTVLAESESVTPPRLKDPWQVAEVLP